MANLVFNAVLNASGFIAGAAAISASMRSLQMQAATTGTAMGGIGLGSAALGAIIPVAAATAVAITTVATASTYLTGTWEQGMAKVSRTTGIERGTAAYEELNKTLLNLLATTPAVGSDLQDIAYRLGALGIQTPAEIGKATEAIYKMTQGLDVNAETAITWLGIMKNFFPVEYQAMGMEKFANSLGSVVNEMERMSPATSEQIMQGMLASAQWAQTLGLDIPKLAAAVTTMVSQRIEPGEIETMFRSLSRGLAGPIGEAARNTLAEVGIQLQKGAVGWDLAGALLGTTKTGAIQRAGSNIMKFMDDLATAAKQKGLTGIETINLLGEAAGVYAASSVSRLSGTFEEYTRYLSVASDEMAKGTSLNIEYARSIDNMISQGKIAINTMKVLMITIGSMITPYVTRAFQGFASGVRDINNALSILIGHGAGVGRLFDVIKGNIMGIPAMFGTINFEQVGWSLGRALMIIPEFLYSAFEKIDYKYVGTLILDGLTAGFNIIKGALGGIGKSVYGLIFDEEGKFIVAQNLSRVITAAVDMMAPTLISIGQNIQKFMMFAWGEVGIPVQLGLQDAFMAIANAAIDAFNAAGEAAASFANTLTSMVVGAIADVISALGDLAAAAVQVLGGGNIGVGGAPMVGGYAVGGKVISQGITQVESGKFITSDGQLFNSLENAMSHNYGQQYKEAQVTQDDWFTKYKDLLFGGTKRAEAITGKKVTTFDMGNEILNVYGTLDRLSGGRLSQFVTPQIERVKGGYGEYERKVEEKWGGPGVTEEQKQITIDAAKLNGNIVTYGLKTWVTPGLTGVSKDLKDQAAIMKTGAGIPQFEWKKIPAFKPEWPTELELRSDLQEKRNAPTLDIMANSLKNQLTKTDALKDAIFQTGNDLGLKSDKQWDLTNDLKTLAQRQIDKLEDATDIANSIKENTDAIRGFNPSEMGPDQFRQAIEQIGPFRGGYAGMTTDWATKWKPAEEAEMMEAGRAIAEYIARGGKISLQGDIQRYVRLAQEEMAKEEALKLKVEADTGPATQAVNDFLNSVKGASAAVTIYVSIVSSGIGGFDYGGYGNIYGAGMGAAGQSLASTYARYGQSWSGAASRFGGGMYGGVSYFQSGISYVPYDNLPAILHKGERVLTKEQNTGYSGGGSGLTVNYSPSYNFGSGTTNAKEVQQVLEDNNRELIKLLERKYVDWTKGN